jgi:glycosyltransferase involved in cell wall biosynthesis
MHDPGDFKMLAGHLHEAILDRESCRVRGRNGRKLLLERSANIWINDFNDFVGRIIADARQRKHPSTSHGSRLPLRVTVYLADQNPGYDRSFGISRMSHVVMTSLQSGQRVRIRAIASRTSQQAPSNVDEVRILPWGTRGKWVRLLTDHLHPLFGRHKPVPDIHYFPKGYLPLLNGFCTPSVVTIHDTIIQYDEDHYPHWRKPWEYAYWAMMLKHTLRNASRILTVSEFSKRQIHEFMDRHQIARKEITVTYEPCLYEEVAQPLDPVKENFVIHLASCEPHKRTTHLIRWWNEGEARGLKLPVLHLIGAVPPEALPMLANSHTIIKRPFLEDAQLQAAYLAARALILPSEVEGFGLPALEAYYLGTPVCFVRGTSVEEILSGATDKGGFSLECADTLFAALDEVMRMTPEEVRTCGLRLRATYAADKVVEKMVVAFRRVAG